MIRPEIIQHLPEKIEQFLAALGDWQLIACSGQRALLALFLHNYPCTCSWGVSIAELLAAPLPLRGTVLLLCTDDLPDGTIPLLLEQLRQRLGSVRLRCIALLSDSTTADDLRLLLACGVEGFCWDQSIGGGQLVTAVSALRAGGHYHDPALQRLLWQAPALPLAELSARERELLHQLCCGLSSAQIAARRRIRDDTVRRYLSDLYQKIAVRDRHGAVLWCLGHGLVSSRELSRQSR